MKIPALGAHLDDIELGCGGALARASKAGHECRMICMSDSAYTNYDGKVLRTRDQGLHEGQAAAEALGVSTPSVRASELGGEGVRSELLADLCRRAEADVYLSGPSGRDYLDVRPFRDAGIEVWVHDYTHPEYPQKGGSHSCPTSRRSICSPITARRPVRSCGQGAA